VRSALVFEFTVTRFASIQFEPTGAPMESTGDEDIIAEDLFREGLVALEENEVYEASDLFSQCLQLTSTKHGEHSVKAASVCIKYGNALLGCARAQGTSVLGRIGKVRCSRPGVVRTSLVRYGLLGMKLYHQVLKLFRCGSKRHVLHK
jgi:hypothetical protein